MNNGSFQSFRMEMKILMKIKQRKLLQKGNLRTNRKKLIPKLNKSLKSNFLISESYNTEINDNLYKK